MKYLTIFIVLAGFGSTVCGDEAAKKVKYNKTQEVNFEDQSIDGKINSPDGAYLLQKRGVQFIPLYKVNNQFEKNILESVEYSEVDDEKAGITGRTQI